MNSKFCEGCAHFRLDYIKFGRSYQPISYGHCVYPRLKKRERERHACENWKEK